ncbi:MAG: hemerythrin domain-containing protein [Acidobacteria bacterium]|nr:hemerythrin domain-containing protein [Acidobacteriota bacterium]MCA1649720.1 hemerythrin domain-containing protein [Acidobacteriota bacterium]
MAKRGSRKTAAKKRSGAKRATDRASSTRTKGRSTKRAGAKPSGRKTARRKNAARAVATRSARKRPTPEPSKLASAATAVKGAVAGAVEAVAKRLPWTSSEPDAVTLLETDHRRLEDLLKKGEETTERAVKGRTQLLHTLTSELTVHELIEEKILYPALRAHPEAKDIVLEGYQEHHVADLIVKELHTVHKDDEQWGAKFKVLKENIEHHIKEEEGEMFRTARGVFSREDLHQLGVRMATMKAEVQRGRSRPT